MKRGGVRTHKRYDVGMDGKRVIKYEIQGRKNGVWIPVVETGESGKERVPMIYDTLKEAETKLKEIVKQIRKR